MKLLLSGVPRICAAQESNQEPKQAYHGKLRCYRYTNGAGFVNNPHPHILAYVLSNIDCLQKFKYVAAKRKERDT